MKHKGQWYPGNHEPLIDRATWDRVQALLGQKIYQTHRLTYGSELIRCGHCGSPITGERKTKRTKNGEREYVYYRCAHYHRGDHPRIRMTEAEFDEQMLALFDRLRVESDEFRNEFREGLRKLSNWDQESSIVRAQKLQDGLSSVRQQQKRLVNHLLLEEIDPATFAETRTELRDREAQLKLQIDSNDRARHEIIDIAVKAFELSQNLRAKWFEADYAAKRRILEIICLNWTLDGVNLVPTMRKPFDMLAEGLVWKDSRDGGI